MTEEVKRGKTPLYRKVSEEIRRDIVSGIYVPGEILPSIRDKAKSLGVARNTVDTAYQILAEEGYIRSRRDAEYFMKKALEKGVKVSARNGHNTPGTNRRLYVTLNYSSVPYEKIGEGIDILTGVLKGSSNP